MALSRKYLAGMGLNEEQINAIIEANEETITGLKAEIEKHKTASESSDKTLAKAQKELDALKKEAEESASKNPYKVKYDAIKEEFEKFKADETAKATKAAKSDAYKELLKECGISEKRIASVLKVSDTDSIELDENGKIKDSETLKKSITEEWEDFIPKDLGAKGAETAKPLTNTGGKMTKDQILAITDTAERQKAMYENRELFF